MTVFGIPPWRFLAYLAVAVALVGLNLFRLAGGDGPVVSGPGDVPADLPALPDLAVKADFDGFAGPPPRSLFRPAEDVPPPPPAAPEPVAAPPPPPDPEAEARDRAERLLDSISVIGFLSTTEGVAAVLDVGGRIVNAFEGDRPVAGFVVSDVTIDSVTLAHRLLDLERSFGLGDAD